MFVVALIVGSLILHFTRLGRNAYAVGSNEEAAFLSGRPGRPGQGDPVLAQRAAGRARRAAAAVAPGAGDAASGQGLELDAIAAAVLGGASLLGGRGSMFGAFLGVMLLGVIANSLTLLDVSSFYQRLVLGGLLIFAVTTTAIAEKRRGSAESVADVFRRLTSGRATYALDQRKGVELMRVGIDVGGTFTDLFAYDETSGETHSSKVLTTLDNQALGVLQSVAAGEVDLAGVSFLAHGTTTGTNSLIERKGAACGLLTTQGFRDVLEIMRSFSATNSGCLFELGQLVACSLLGRTLFVVDETTDVALVQATLRDQARQLGVAAVPPNIEQVNRASGAELDRLRRRLLALAA